jgi:hypothetical protein
MKYYDIKLNKCVSGDVIVVTNYITLWGVT